jgi:hypothetical protein
MLFVLRDGREVFAFDGSINRITSGGLNVWGQLAYDSVSIYIHSLSPKKLNNCRGLLEIANEIGHRCCSAPMQHPLLCRIAIPLIIQMIHVV